MPRTLQFSWPVQVSPQYAEVLAGAYNDVADEANDPADARVTAEDVCHELARPERERNCAGQMLTVVLRDLWEYGEFARSGRLDYNYGRISLREEPKPVLSHAARRRRREEGQAVS